ncbi:MAG TPA: FixH family protein [Myxococcota bacterium]|nr:FixH family protein [Myxococcota bacterium]
MTTRAESENLRWPLGLALALGAGLATSLAFLVIAASQPPDWMDGDMWRSGAEYNAGQEARARGRALGWEVGLSAERSADGVQVTLSPTQRDAPLGAGVPVRLVRERPGRVDFDSDIPLTRANEAWRATVPLPLPGHWLLRVRVGDDAAFIEREFALERAP